MGFLIVCIVLAPFVLWPLFYYRCSKYKEQPVSAGPSKRQIEQQKFKQRLKERGLRAEVMTAYFENPKNKEAIKLLLLKEIKSKNIIKGKKRRILSDLKYDAIKKASETGKFNDEVLDFLNSQ